MESGAQNILNLLFCLADKNKPSKIEDLFKILEGYLQRNMETPVVSGLPYRSDFEKRTETFTSPTGLYEFRTRHHHNPDLGYEFVKRIQQGYEFDDVQKWHLSFKVSGFLRAMGTNDIRMITIPGSQLALREIDTIEKLLPLVWYFGQNDFQPLGVRSMMVGDRVRLGSGREFEIRLGGWEEVTQENATEGTKDDG